MSALKPSRRKTSHYEADPHAWYVEQARLLRAGRLSEVDAANIAEELEDMGRSEARELRSSLRLILSHLLKWRYQPELRSKSWTDTIERERDNAALALEDNPSLRTNLPRLFAQAYRLARREAARETGLGESVFPVRPPLAVEEAFRAGYLPVDDR